MWTIIILVILNFIILKLFGINILKHLLFNPKINASITVVAIVLYIIEFAVSVVRIIPEVAVNPRLIGSVILLIGLIVVWTISILDCIQDIRRGEEYYGRGENYYGLVEDRISKLYAVKSITSWLTGGLSRAVFYLVTSRYIPKAALADVKATFEGKRPVEVNPQYPYGSSFVANFFAGFYSIEFLRFADPYITNAVSYVVENMFLEWKAVRYKAVNPSYGCPYTDYRFVMRYGEKYDLLRPEIENRIKRNLESGKFLTNERHVDEEFKLREDRLAEATEKEEDKNFVVKVIENIPKEGREALAKAREEIENARNELSSKESLYTYVDYNFYEECKRKAVEALSDKTCMPVRNIVELEELSFLNDLQKKGYKPDQRWREYFVIFIMQSLVQDGIVKDESALDGILDTHQYGLADGRPMLERDGNNNPALALDDDD